MKKILAIAAVATVAFVGQAHAQTNPWASATGNTFTSLLRQAWDADNGLGGVSHVAATTRAYTFGYNGGSAAKHAENTAKVHNFAGDAYQRATGMALYGGVGRASRNLAAALDSQGAEIDRLNGVIAGEAARTATAVTAGVDAARNRGVAQQSAAEANVDRIWGIVGPLGGSLAHANLGTHRYDNTAPVGYANVDIRGTTDDGTTYGEYTAYAANPHAVLNQIAAGTARVEDYVLDGVNYEVSLGNIIDSVLDGVYSEGYDDGYADGYRDGYAEGFADGVGSVR